MTSEEPPVQVTEKSQRKREISLPAAIGILFSIFVLVLSAGLFVGYRYYWNKFDRTPRIEAELAKYAQVLEKEPDNFEAVYQLGWTYFQKGDYEKALEYNKKAMDMKPEHAGVAYNVGITYFALKQYEPASAEFKKLADKYPRHELAWLSLGQSYLELGRNEEAVKTLEHTLTINPTSADINYSLGQAWERTGQKEKAIEAYKEALRFDPQYGPASEALKKLGVADA